MTAYYKKHEGQYHLLLLLDGKVCDGGKCKTKRDVVNYCKRELGIKEIQDWRKK